MRPSLLVRGAVFVGIAPTQLQFKSQEPRARQSRALDRRCAPGQCGWLYVWRVASFYAVARQELADDVLRPEGERVLPLANSEEGAEATEDVRGIVLESRLTGPALVVGGHAEVVNLRGLARVTAWLLWCAPVRPRPRVPASACSPCATLFACVRPPAPLCPCVFAPVCPCAPALCRPGRGVG